MRSMRSYRSTFYLIDNNCRAFALKLSKQNQKSTSLDSDKISCETLSRMEEYLYEEIEYIDPVDDDSIADSDGNVENKENVCVENIAKVKQPMANKNQFAKIAEFMNGKITVITSFTNDKSSKIFRQW